MDCLAPCMHSLNIYKEMADTQSDSIAVWNLCLFSSRAAECDQSFLALVFAALTSSINRAMELIGAIDYP